VDDAEPLLMLPAAPFPATVVVDRAVADDASFAFRGNRYAVPPGLGGATVEVRHRLGTSLVSVHSAAGSVMCEHRLAPAGAGTLVRTPELRDQLERAVLSALTTARPCDTKANRPPSPEALAEAAKLLGAEGADVVVDLAAYGRLAEGGGR